MRSGWSRAFLLVAASAVLVGGGGRAAIGAVAPGAREGSPRPSCLGRRATIVGEGTIRGSAHADVIVAGPGADKILGGGGNDRICAGGGDDLVEGGPGSDRIEAGAGADEVIGANGSDLVLGGPGDDTVFGKRGNDRLYGGAGTDYLDSGLGDDTVDGGSGDGDQVIGGVGNDHLAGGPGDGDVLEGDLGADSLNGGAGTHDTASYALQGMGGTLLGGRGIRVDLAAGTAHGGGDAGDVLSGIEDVFGTAFADTISGDAEPNDLYGGGGIDELTGVGAGDAAFGGTGLDRCRAVASAESCELSPDSAIKATSEVAGRPYLGYPVPPPTFEVDLPGGAASGALTGIVEPGSDFVETMPGVRVHVAFLEGAWMVTEQGLPIEAGEGCVPLGTETARCPVEATPTGLLLEGGRGDDLLAVERSVPATVSSTLAGGGGLDTLVGGAGDDDLTGAIGEGDTLDGGLGEDALAGGDAMNGGGGSDLLIASPCGEEIDGGPGIDSVSFARFASGGGVEATLGGSADPLPWKGTPGGCADARGGPSETQIDTSVESIEGSRGDDLLSGDGADNILLGRGGDDTVRGGMGDDFLVGGDGSDALYGEGGADRLYARDGHRDEKIDCGSGVPGDVAVTDADDPPSVGCVEPGTPPAHR